MKSLNQKGITLISLVIAIIVLLILATISISMLTGDNGILSQVKKAKEETQIAAYKEALEIIGLELETEKVDESNYFNRYKEEIMFEGSTVDIINNKMLKVITKEGYTFRVTRGKVEYLGKGEIEIEEPEIPELQEGDIIFTCNPTTPTNGDVEVTIETKIELGENWIEYSINNGALWIKYENSITVDKNGKIEARISNNAGSSVNTATQNVTNIDKLDPNEPTLGITGVTENSITVVANAEDRPKTNEYASSGIKGYQFSKDNGNTWEPTIPQARGTYTFSNLTAGTSYTLKVKAIDNANNETEIENAVTETTEKHIDPIETTTSYVGNYADTNGDGYADGIIFADLAVGGSGQWGNSWGGYSIPTASNLKEYYIKEENYSKTPKFGDKQGSLIAPVEGTSGNDRFYIMALEDVSSTTYYWYYNASGKLDNTVGASTNDFGTGREKTAYVMNKWTSSSWGAQNSRDMCGAIQNQVNEGWFVPSKSEWAAFGGNLGITTSNYSNYGLSDWYWSSSQNTTNNAYLAYFNYGTIGIGSVDYTGYVRLCATF